jgi:hypothetical protein
LRSKRYEDGEEVWSEDSYLFKWKPDYIANKENYWDKKKDKFAVSRGATKKADGLENSTDKDKLLNDAIIDQIEKLAKYYEAEGDKGRTLGYRRALTFLRGYDKPIKNVQ